MAVASHLRQSDHGRVSTREGLRVLWLTTSADTDGPGRALLAVVNRWSDKDAVAVCGLRGVSETFRSECRPAVEAHAMGMRGGWDIAAVIRLARFCRRWRPDVIHTQLSRADWIGRPLARALGVPVLSTIHNVHSRMYDAEFTPFAARFGRACDRWSATFVTRFVAVSTGVQRDLEAAGVRPDRIVVIHNGLNVDRRPAADPRDLVRRVWGVTSADIVIGTVALFKAQKGLSFLVEAARIATAVNPRLRFVHIGDGPLRDEVARQIEVAGLGDRFRLLDRVPDPMRLLSGLDVFVLPSIWEGLPIALLEAMAAGLPAVGTAVSGIEDVIEHNRSGLLVPPADACALADAILRVASDPPLRSRLAEAALARVARFSSDLVSSEYRQVTLQVLASDESAGGHARRPAEHPQSFYH